MTRVTLDLAELDQLSRQLQRASDEYDRIGRRVRLLLEECSSYSSYLPFGALDLAAGRPLVAAAEELRRMAVELDRRRRTPGLGEAGPLHFDLALVEKLAQWKPVPPKLKARDAKPDVVVGHPGGPKGGLPGEDRFKARALALIAEVAGHVEAGRRLLVAWGEEDAGRPKKPDLPGKPDLPDPELPDEGLEPRPTHPDPKDLFDDPVSPQPGDDGAADPSEPVDAEVGDVGGAPPSAGAQEPSPVRAASDIAPPQKGEVMPPPPAAAAAVAAKAKEKLPIQVLSRMLVSGATRHSDILVPAAGVAAAGGAVALAARAGIAAVPNVRAWARRRTEARAATSDVGWSERTTDDSSLRQVAHV